MAQQFFMTLHAILLMVACSGLFHGGTVDAADSTTSLRGGRLSPDPKSVVTKQPPDESLAASDSENFYNLRFLFFGTSRTYGVMLGDDRTTSAYPFLLSKKAVNLAIPAGSPYYPLKCAFSMMEEHENGDAFDVIVLEYNNIFSGSAYELAKRLRHRYPNALILFLDMWLMIMYEHIPSGKNMASWSGEEGFQIYGSAEGIDPNLSKHILQTTKPQQWKYPSSHRYSMDTKAKALRELNATVVSPPLPRNLHFAMASSDRNIFFKDMNHFSKVGHQYVAQMIRQQMTDMRFRTHHDSTLTQWGHSDQCSSWLLTGVVDRSMVHVYLRWGLAWC